jgi:glycosyltransferase involved in cell wall biosynthesis
VRRLNHPQVTLLSQKNAGVAAARNHGIVAANSELVAFLDADDEWAPDHLAAIMNLSTQYPHCEVFATSYLIRVSAGDDHTAVLRGCAFANGEGVITDYFSVASQSDPPLWSSAVATTTSAILSIGGFPEGIAQGEDLLTWAKLATKFSIAYATRPSAIFWQPEFRQAKPTRRPETPDRVGGGLEALLNDVPSSKRRSLYRYIALWHRMRGNMFLRLNERVEARKEFLKAIGFGGPTLKLSVYLVLAHLPRLLTQLVIRLLSRVNALRRRMTSAPELGT